jgi:outer membrane protein assembly factor BamB
MNRVDVMKRTLIITSILLIISIIVITGCISGSDDSASNGSASDGLKPVSTGQLDPVQLLKTHTWIWPSTKRVKDVSISDDGSYIGGLTTQKAKVKTPSEYLLTESVWSEGNCISISGSGDYIAIADKYTLHLFDDIGDKQHVYFAKGTINNICMLDSGIIIQGGEEAPHLSAVDSQGNELWVWNPGSATAEVIDFEYSPDAENMLVSTDEDRIYCLTNTGTYKWFKDLSGSVEDIKMSDDGEKMYALAEDNKVYSFDKYGNKNWEKELEVGAVEIEIDKMGNYILAKSGNKVYLLDNQGNVEWVKPLSDVGVIGISEEAQYIVISDKRNLRMYNLKGDELASYLLDDEYGTKFVSLAMTPDASKLVLGTTNSMLIFG